MELGIPLFLHEREAATHARASGSARDLLAILDEDRPSVSFSPAEVLEAASQERAKKLHDKQVRLLGKAERTRATVVQMKGSAGDQRHNVRKFARATGQF